jgi:hypothetical protein
MASNQAGVMISRYKCGTPDFPGCGLRFALDRPQPILRGCPVCLHMYITWTNSKEVLNELRRDAKRRPTTNPRES